MNDFAVLLFTTQKYSSFNPPYFLKRTLKFFLDSIPACSVNWYSSMKKKLRKIRIIFGIENWLWKSEIGNFRSLDLERVLIYQNFFLWKSAIFHSIKLPFDAKADEIFLNVIYYACIGY